MLDCAEQLALYLDLHDGTGRLWATAVNLLYSRLHPVP
jgi:hypothetical protein